MSECDRFEMLISEYVDGELQEPEKTELELHLKRCSRCRRLCDAFRAISLSLGEEAAPAGFTAQVMAAVSTRGESGATMAKKPGRLPGTGRTDDSTACHAVRGQRRRTGSGTARAVWAGRRAEGV